MLESKKLLVDNTVILDDKLWVKLSQSALIKDLFYYSMIYMIMNQKFS